MRPPPDEGIANNSQNLSSFCDYYISIRTLMFLNLKSFNAFLDGEELGFPTDPGEIADTKIEF